MRVLIQKCSEASVSFGDVKRSISKGLVLFVGFTPGDDIKKIQWMARKVANLRIFEDAQGIMNHSVLDVSGEVLSISQFTLYGDATSGNRPSYMKAMKSEEAKVLYHLFNQELQKLVSVTTGFFKEDMKVELINLGPTTIFLEK
jgi:D-tyrosyl-tRNA(Tyr) deacylase